VKFSNEIKVGLTIIVATVIFILGVRYFEDLPLFDKTYDLVAEFDNAAGLIGGNIVRVNGVAVGSVNRVYISETSGKVMAEFHVNPSIPVTEGSYAMVGGFDALGVTRLELVLGEPDAPRIPEGGMVATRPSADLMAEMSTRAPRLMEGADQVLVELNAVLAETNRMLSTPESDFRRTLASAQGSVSQIEQLLASERDRIASILAGLDTVTSDIDTALGPDGENVSDLMARMEQTLETLDRDLEAFSETNAQLTVLLRKLNEGEGTLGLLINDPSMYHRMDSTLTGLNELIADFRDNPARYLKEMKLVDLF
jgi:phospholipid/cholesterol/gamma-HCH transport system substrate-binding protein